MTTAPKKPATEIANRLEDSRSEAPDSDRDSRSSREAAGAAQTPADRILSSEAVEAILDSSASSLRDHAMLILAYDAAMRVSDLCALRLGDVNVNSVGDCGPSLVLMSSRLLRPRRVPITPRAAQAVRDYIQGCRRDAKDDEPLFVGRFGKALTQSGLDRVLQRHVGAASERRPELFAGIRVRPSDLRRSAAAHLYEQGTSLSTITCILGIESPRLTLQYYIPHAGADALRQKGGQQWT